MMQSHFIRSRWIEGSGPHFASTEPLSGQLTWQGREAVEDEVAEAVAAARDAFETWADTPLARRIEHLHAFASQLKADRHAGRRRQEMISAICRDVGKPQWESASEVDLMVAKVAASIEAYTMRRAIDTRPIGQHASGWTRYKPFGVMAVLGPFNLPGHLPNGHIVPALLAGNTVVFKPSELAPAVGQVVAERWESAGLPAGVFNMVQGKRTTGAALVHNAGIDGLLFTGSYTAGQALMRALSHRPEVIVALEMGGNNPLVVHEVGDIAAAAVIVAQSAFITAGQRCTCARRLVVPEGAAGDELLARVAKLTETLRVGRYDANPPVFMGPVISVAASELLLSAQADLRRRGGRGIVEMKPVEPARVLLRPGIIDVTAVADRADDELFGPLLQVIRVTDFDAAIREANATRYGLAAGLLSDRRDLYEQFHARVRAGIINWNRELTGASGRLPFGGVGRSGNNRPSGAWAADYCSYPVASIEMERLDPPADVPPGLVVHSESGQ